MNELQVWVLSGVLGVFGSLLLILFKKWLTDTSKIIELINQLRLELVKQNEQLKTLFSTSLLQKEELKGLEKRILELERNNRKR
ncbi:MAG: hypothetical protein MI784_01685 [Cytophagales bacterium]|nr:hypothetical protein [Cytophagales bacterium]